MAHLNPNGSDWVNAAFIVHPDRQSVLLVKHKKLGTLLPVGGHIELDHLNETPDQALIREVLEETGLIVCSDQLNTYDPFDAVVYQTDDQKRFRQASLEDPGTGHNRLSVQHWVPWAFETHDFPPLPGHKHVCLIYLILSLSAQVKLELEAHDAIRWYSRAELTDPGLVITPKIVRYSLAALATAQSKYR